MQTLNSKRWFITLVLILISAGALPAGTFGTVVPIGGHASDLALDEGRNRLYIANFTANRIEVLNRADRTLDTPIRVAPQPSTLALSADRRYLVVGHYSQWPDDPTLKPSLTILDLLGGTRRSVALERSPLAVAFGNGARALVVTTDGFWLLNPATGLLQPLTPAIPLGSEDLPVDFATFPPEIIQASTGVSGNGNIIYVLASIEAGGNTAAILSYNVTTTALSVIGILAEPPLGPRVISVDETGDNYLAGWALFGTVRERLVALAQFPRPTGEFNIGSHAFDHTRKLIYGHIPAEAAQTEAPPDQPSQQQDEEPPPEEPAEPPVLTIFDSDNLTVRERLLLPENLAGRSLLSADKRVMYAISDSGVMELPVGSLDQTPRVVFGQEDLLFLASGCDRSIVSQQVDVLDPGGGRTDFTLSANAQGVRITPSSGTTPARVTIEVDLTVFQNRKGTLAIPVELTSAAAVNIATPLRLLVNTKEPNQRGNIVNAPGKIVDLLADPARDRYYLLRQDKNLVLVFDGTTHTQIASFRTGNTPMQMAMTLDRRYLLVGNDNSQLANVYDLETLQASDIIIFGLGYYPRSLAVSKNAILATSRSVGEPLPGCGRPHAVHRIDFLERVATPLPSLGIYCNGISEETVLAATPSAQKILAMDPDGNVLLYEDEAATFVASRQDFNALGGAYVPVNDDLFIVQTHLLNKSLVPKGELNDAGDPTSGLALADQYLLRTTSSGGDDPGNIQRVDLDNLNLLPTYLIESPLISELMLTDPVGQIGQSILPFSRTLSPLSNRNFIVSLSISGLTVLPWNYDEAVAEPVIQGVVNSADYTPGVAPGGLISVFGQNLSSGSFGAGQLPLPTVLGEACLTVNEEPVPLLYVSPGQINGQLPFDVSGSARMVLRTPGGISAPFEVTIRATAPAIFRTATAGPKTGIATVFRTVNNAPVTLSNPVHPEDYLVIYTTGMGRTTGDVAAGFPSPADPLATVLAPPEVSLGGVQLPVLFAGLVPGLVGLYQINVGVPDYVPEGIDIPLTVTQGGYSVTLSVRVVK